MNDFFSLLTKVSKVSNNYVPNWAHIAIQFSMWIAVVSQIFLLVPDMIYVIKSRDTRENKWFKWIVWFVCSAGWISYSIFLLWENIPISESIGLVISEGINLICLFVIYGIKIHNIKVAKSLEMTETQWCMLLRTTYLIRKSLTHPIKKKLKESCKNLSPKEKIELYLNALKTYRVAHKIRKASNKVAKHIIKKAKKKRQ